MLRLLKYFPLNAMAALSAGPTKLPFGTGAVTLVPDEVFPMDTEAQPVPPDDPAALETRVLEILRVASQMPPGSLRRDALAEVNRLRQRAIELHRDRAAELRARRASLPRRAD